MLLELTQQSVDSVDSRFVAKDVPKTLGPPSRPLAPLIDEFATEPLSCHQ